MQGFNDDWKDGFSSGFFMALFMLVCVLLLTDYSLVLQVNSEDDVASNNVEVSSKLIELNYVSCEKDTVPQILVHNGGFSNEEKIDFLGYDISTHSL